MSSGGAFGGARGYKPKPPDKGVFPLDHFGECKQAKEAYLNCVKGNSGRAESCTELSKAYLQCRMDRNLMAVQDLGELGFRDNKAPAAPAAAQSGEGDSDTARRKQQGFVAGIKK